MHLLNSVKKIFKPKLELVKGTRFISFLFIGLSILIAAGVLWGANLYYNIDTGEIVMEEIQRVTQTIRATASLIVAGTATQNPAAGVTLEVATGTVSLSGADQVLRFTGGSASYYTGFRATTTMTTTTVYYLPPRYADAADYILTWQSGNQLAWKPATGTAGVGDITAVGDVDSGAAFTAAATGTSLWFHRSGFTGQLVVAGALNANRAYTLPDLTGIVALNSSSLTDGGVLFAAEGLINQDAVNFYWSTSTGRLGIGTNSPDYTLDVNGTIRTGREGTSGQLRIYSEQVGTDYELVFQPSGSMTTTTIYTWPVNYGTSTYVLTTDGSGGLVWTSVTGVGAVTGSGELNRLARWTSGTNLATSSIVDNYSGTALTIDVAGTTTIANNLIVSGAGGITANLFTGPSGATTTIASLNNNNIYLDPDGSGKIIIASGDYIKTASGYEIGKSGIQVLREMIPILGFDLPAQTGATSSYVTISRTIENYPFAATSSGATRVHKFVIRYVDDLPTASSSDWRVYNVTDDATTTTFTVEGCADNTLSKGKTQIVQTDIPTDGDDWRLDVKIPSDQSGKKIRVFEILLAAYDQIQ